jgi:hypothetical protein
MDNKTKEILQKFSAQRVELSLVNELKKLQRESSDAYVSYIDDMDASKGFMQKARSKAENAVKLLQKTINLYEDVEAKYKELGVDMPSKLKQQTPRPALQESQKDLKMMNDLFSKFKVR